MEQSKLNNLIKERKMSPINKIARIAGGLYLLYVVTSIVADIFGKFVFSDAFETVNNIMTNDSSFRIGFVISLFSAAIFLFAAWALYVLLKPVNKNLALLFLLLNFAGFAIWNFSLLSLFAGQMFLSGVDYLKVFTPDQLQAQAMLFIDLRRIGAVAAQVPFGLWLFPLGYLVFKSGFLPKALGIILAVDGVALMIYVCQKFLFPSLGTVSIVCMAIGFVAEVSLTLWLLIKGVKENKKVLVK
jgi:hypothetical protein